MSASQDLLAATGHFPALLLHQILQIMRPTVFGVIFVVHRPWAQVYESDDSAGGIQRCIESGFHFVSCHLWECWGAIVVTGFMYRVSAKKQVGCQTPTWVGEHVPQKPFTAELVNDLAHLRRICE